ncbi:MAG: hypothetical protein ACTSW8_10485, partial [Candidatus Thorarchaeota archaeon]
DDSFIYELVIARHGMSDRYKTYSRLLGKDVILPNQEISLQQDKEYAEFKVVNRNGEEIESTSNEKELSNFFTDRMTPHFLTPVFFSSDVIGR